MSEMGELFPELESILANWDAGISDDSGQLPPEHSGVTDSDVEQAAARMLANGQRPGPAPVVPGQAPPTNQFAPGQTAPPPPPAYVEGDANGNGNAGTGTVAPEADAGQPPSEGTVISPVPESGTPVTEPTPADDYINLGVDDNNTPILVERSKLLAYRGFEQELLADPKLQQFLAHYLTTGELPSGVVGDGSAGTVQPPLSPEPSSRVPESTIPEGIADDPTLSAMWTAQQQQIAQLTDVVNNLSGGLQTTVQQQQLRQQAENESIIKRATASFQSQHQLTDEDMTTLRRTAANLNVLQPLMSGIDPMTGAPSKPDPLAAVERSLEIAMFSIPEYRNRAFAQTVRRRVEDGRRKQKLGALSGSSGSVPRTTQAPTTAEGRRDAMVRELASMQAGEWSEPE